MGGRATGALPPFGRRQVDDDTWAGLRRVQNLKPFADIR